MADNTTVIGSTIKCMDAEFSPGQTAAAMKESTMMIVNRVKVSSPGPTEDVMRAAGLTESSMALAYTTHLKAKPKKVSGAKASVSDG
jgi:hypothetical protein